MSCFRFILVCHSESLGRAAVLKDQLRELQDHRRLFHVRNFFLSCVSFICSSSSQEAHNADGTWRNTLIPRNVAERIQENMPFSGSIRGKSPKSVSPSSPTAPEALSPKSTVISSCLSEIFLTWIVISQSELPQLIRHVRRLQRLGGQGCIPGSIRTSTTMQRSISRRPF